MRALSSSSRNPHESLSCSRRQGARFAAVSKDREQESNSLLRREGALSRPRREAYTQAQLVRKMASDRTMADIAGASSSSGAASGLRDYLFDRVVSEIAVAARLTLLQEACFRLSEGGMGVRGIGLALGIGRMRVHRQLKIARHRLRLAYGRYDCFGWEDVYWAEVNRG